MHSFLDSLMPTVERIEEAPAAFETTLRSLMSWLKASTREVNIHAFADAVTARIPELVGANIANTAAAPKDDEDEGSTEPEGEASDPAQEQDDTSSDIEAEPEGSEAVVVPNKSRRQRPSSQDVKTSGPAAATNEGSPADAVTANTAPNAAGFAGFSQQADHAATPSAPRAS